MTARVGDTSGTPSMIGWRVARIITGPVVVMPATERAGWYRDLARMLLVAADKWEAYLASDRGKQWDDSETGGES